MSTPYTLFKRKYIRDGVLLTPIETHSTFRSAWNAAIDLFDAVGLTIVGCHYDDGLTPEAEFFVVAPGIHETYMVRPTGNAISFPPPIPTEY